MPESEADFQRAVVELAGLLGWRVMHVRRSIGRRGGGQAWQTTTSIKGWPDLLAWRLGRSPGEPGQVIAAELKSDTGRLTPEQTEVLAELAACGIPTYVWRPRDWDDLVAVLRR